MTIKGQHDKRPDVVLYVNGIAVVVLELKRSTVSVSEGIRQNLDNQKDIFIKNFFATNQIVMAGNDSEGLRHGVIKTPEKYFLTWKEDIDIRNRLDKHLYAMCQKERLPIAGLRVFPRVAGVPVPGPPAGLGILQDLGGDWVGGTPRSPARRR